MKVVDCPRSRLYYVVAAAFAAEGCRPAMIELGVHKGDNAARLMEVLKPRHHGSDIPFVEVMPQMLPSAHIRVSPQGRTRVSFA